MSDHTLTSTQTSLPERLRKWRADTPGCELVTHLNNCGAALMTTPVIRAIHDYLNLEANTGGYEAEVEQEAAIQETYTLLARLINAAPRNIAIVANATAGFVQALSTIAFSAGDAIVTSRCDYTSNQIQYLSLARQLGVDVRHAGDLPEGGVDPESVRSLIRKGRCKLVAVSWVPTNSGLVQDVEAVGKVCEEEGVTYLVDACQVLGQLPIDVTRLRCDYLTTTSRKFLRGPRGLGFLYASDRALARGDYPLFVDMRGARWTSPTDFSLAETAQRFEDWESPWALVLGMSEAARYAIEVGPDCARATALANILRSKLSALDGVRVLDRGRNPCAIVTAALDGYDASSVQSRLRERAINISATFEWYGLYDMREKRASTAIRVSPHYYNTESELDSFITALQDIIKTA